MRRAYRGVRRWLAYTRHLDNLVNAHVVTGYKLTAATHERYREQARERAAYEWPT